MAPQRDAGVVRYRPDSIVGAGELSRDLVFPGHFASALSRYKSACADVERRTPGSVSIGSRTDSVNRRSSSTTDSKLVWRPLGTLDPPSEGPILELSFPT